MYLVDTNEFITAKNTYYGFDFAPGFWEWLDQQAARGTLASVDHVRDELLVKDDEIAEWAKRRPHFFHDIDETASAQVGRLVAWVNSQQFTQNAIQKFTGNAADIFLIAYAKAHDCVVVTREISDPKSRRRVLIPDACKAMGVSVVNIHEVMRRTGARLVLP